MADYYGTDTVVSELREDGLLIIRINRPDVANALNGVTSKAMENIMNNAETDPAVRAIIVTGTGKGFSPDAALTRESLAAILFRYAGGQVSADDLSGYADGAVVSAWAREAMNWAGAQGLITGKSGGRLDPGGTASRAEVSAILMRYVQSAQA